MEHLAHAWPELLKAKEKLGLASLALTTMSFLALNSQKPPISTADHFNLSSNFPGRQDV